MNKIFPVSGKDFEAFRIGITAQLDNRAEELEKSISKLADTLLAQNEETTARLKEIESRLSSIAEAVSGIRAELNALSAESTTRSDQASAAADRLIGQAENTAMQLRELGNEPAHIIKSITGAISPSVRYTVYNREFERTFYKTPSAKRYLIAPALQTECWRC